MSATPALSGAVKCTCCNHIEGVREERAKVLTWLRTVALTHQAQRFAECIERGDHWSSPPITEGSKP